MAKQSVYVGMYYSGQWQDVSSDVFVAEGITARRGNGDEAGSNRPAQLALTFNDAAGTYNPRNPMSPLYGLAGRNTPVMLGLDKATEGFEDASLDVTITNGGSANWARTSTQAHTGTWSLKSGVIAASQNTDAIITAPAGATMCTLWYMVSSASGDNLRISTGGTLRLQTSGVVGWTQLTVPVVPNTLGVREVFVRYIKDASGVAGSDAAYIDDVHFYDARVMVEASSWSPDRTIDFNASTGKGRAAVDLVGEGVLRRIGQWTDPLRSPMYRNTTGYTTLVGYWPWEDSRNATQLTNAAGGGTPGTASGLTFAFDDGPGGSDPLAEVVTATVATGTFLTASSSAGWQISFSAKLPAVPGTATYRPLFSWKTSNGYSWSFEVDSTTYRILVLDSDGTSLLDVASGYGSGASPNQWITYRVKVSASGGTVTVEPAWYPEGGTALGISPTFSGTMGYLKSWRVTGNEHNDGALYGHIFGLTTVADDLQSYNARRSFDGYPGETAGDRFVRLCGEEGITAELVGTSASTQAMGVQKSDTFSDLLDEIATTEDALIFDTRRAIGLTMRTRIDRYNQTAALALTFGTDVAPPLAEVIDDLDTHNRVTVKQRDGGEATASLLTGALSVQSSPAGVGEYKQSVDVNVDDETDLPLLAGWWLSKGTVDRSRYPTVTVDLDANPSIAASAALIDMGDRITIDGYEANQIGLTVIGLSESIGSHRRRITFVCAPDQVWLTGIYDATTRRADSASTTLGSGVTSSATAFTFSTTDSGDVWSTVNEPYDVLIAGERITVTTMNAATGSGPYSQTATVTRAVNGVAKALTAGESIHVYQPARWAL